MLPLNPTEFLWIFAMTPGSSAQKHILENLLEGGDPWEPSMVIHKEESLRLFLFDALILGEAKLGSEEVKKRLRDMVEFVTEAQTISEAESIGNTVLYLLQRNEKSNFINEWWMRRGDLDEAQWTSKALNVAADLGEGSEHIINWINKNVAPSEHWPEEISQKLEMAENPEIQSAFYQTFNVPSTPLPHLNSMDKMRG